MSAPAYQCGHGFKQELPAYRGVRIFLMYCGEVTTSLGPRDFFKPQFVREWIDGALDLKDLEKWTSLDQRELQRVIAADKRTLRRNPSSDSSIQSQKAPK